MSKCNSPSAACAKCLHDQEQKSLLRALKMCTHLHSKPGAPGWKSAALGCGAALAACHVDSCNLAEISAMTSLTHKASKVSSPSTYQQAGCLMQKPFHTYPESELMTGLLAKSGTYM